MSGSALRKASILALLLCFLLPGAFAQESEWPKVASFTRSYPVVFDAGLVAIDWPFTTVDGSAQYLFWCRGGPDDILDAMTEQEGINYVGPLMCVLNEGVVRYEWSLLAEDGVGPWHTRGMFWGSDLLGDCATYPEFGKYRSFRLRGFVLKLAAEDIEVSSDNRVHRFRLIVSLQADPTATSDQAERPGYLRPDEGNCETVVHAKTEKREFEGGAIYIQYSRFDLQNRTQEELDKVKRCATCPGIDGYLPEIVTESIWLEISGMNDGFAIPFIGAQITRSLGLI